MFTIIFGTFVFAAVSVAAYLFNLSVERENVAAVYEDIGDELYYASEAIEAEAEERAEKLDRLSRDAYKRADSLFTRVWKF